MNNAQFNKQTNDAITQRNKQIKHLKQRIAQLEKIVEQRNVNQIFLYDLAGFLKWCLAQNDAPNDTINIESIRTTTLYHDVFGLLKSQNANYDDCFSPRVSGYAKFYLNPEKFPLNVEGGAR